MRLWSLHPRYLDSQGLVALWRESLLAQKVLAGQTNGYQHHPQLHRFSEQQNPQAAIANYLDGVYQESLVRGYRFDKSKILQFEHTECISVTHGQLEYEWSHLNRKLQQRSPQKWEALRCEAPQLHPLFYLISGNIANWEKQS